MKKYLAIFSAFSYAILFAAAFFAHSTSVTTTGAGVNATASVIGTPASLGTPTNTAGASFIGTTFTFTTNVNIVAGDLVVANVQIANAVLSNVVSISDGTNSYSLAKAINNGGTDDNELWYVANATAVGSGATITVTISSVGDASNGITIEAYRVSGIALVPLDQTASQSATTATPSVATGTLAQAKEIVFGASWRGNGTPTYAEATGFSNLVNALSVGNGNGKTSLAYQTVAATSAITYAPTWNSSGRCQTLIASFKGL